MQPPSKNVLFPFVLPPAALLAADRLATALMALVRAVGHVAVTGSTPTLSEAAAEFLLFRLTHLITRLILISNFGIRQTNPKAADRDPTPPALDSDQPPAPRTPAPGLPHRPGWLLAALPDIGPSVAADLRSLLADPATAALLEAAPSLRRALNPLLRSLDLHPPAPHLDPPPAAPRPDRPATRSSPNPGSRTPGPATPPGHPVAIHPAADRSVTPVSLPDRNKMAQS